MNSKPSGPIVYYSLNCVSVHECYRNVQPCSNLQLDSVHEDEEPRGNMCVVGVKL